MIKHLLTTAFATLALVTPALAVELRVSSFEPPQGFYSAQILQAWIDEVGPQLSDDTSLRLYPGAILGAAPAQAELVKAGVADIALVVPNYTPGLFPLSSVVEVPGLIETAADGAAILNDLYDAGALAGEYDGYKVLALFSTPGYSFLMNGVEVTSPGDLNGLKMRTPSPFGTELLSMLGASGVSIPAPQVYENLERNVVSGAVWVMDAYRTFRLNEVAPSVTTPRFTSSPMAILMNEARYNSLSDADRAVIDSYAGRAMSDWVAEIVDRVDVEIQEQFRAEGRVTFVDLSPEQLAEWESALAPAADIWVSQQRDNAAAAAALASARASVE